MLDAEDVETLAAGAGKSPAALFRAIEDVATRLAQAKVTAAAATSSTATVTKVLKGRIKIGDRAAPLGVAQKLVRKVRVTPPSSAAGSARTRQ